MDINEHLGGIDVSIAEMADQLIRLRVVAGGLSLDHSITHPLKLQAGSALLTSSLDLGTAIARLNQSDPEHSWVAAHLLHRPQFEHFMRGAFFAGPATSEEAQTFLDQDRMPRRARETGKWGSMTLAQVVKETSDHWGGGDIPSQVFEGTKVDLHGLVHGGKVIVDIYTHGPALGANKATTEEVCGSMNNPLVVSAIALESLLTLSVRDQAVEGAKRELRRAHALLGRVSPLADKVLGPRRGL